MNSQEITMMIMMKIRITKQMLGLLVLIQCDVVIYNTVNVLKNAPNGHPIAHLQGTVWGDFCQSLIYVLLLSLQCCVWYHDILDHIIMTHDCNIFHYHYYCNCHHFCFCYYCCYCYHSMTIIENIYHNLMWANIKHDSKYCPCSWWELHQ